MTQTVERPRLSRPAPPARQPAPSVLLPGAFAAAWSLAAGFVVFGLPVLLSWATDSRSGSGALAATQAVGQLWLVAHGVAMTVPTGTVHLAPLGLVALPLLLLHRAGRHAARTVPTTRTSHLGRLALAVAVPYSLAVAIVSALATTHDVQPHAVGALLSGLAVALVGAGSGLLRERGLPVRRVPSSARALARATGVAVGTLLAGGALMAGLAVALHGGRVSSLASASDPGFLGGLALLLLGLAFVPNVAVWGASWTTGAGFAVGVGTSVSPWSTQLGAVPAFPLLGALPSHAPPTSVAVLVLLLPLAAGALAGWSVGRASSATTLLRAAGEGALVAPLAALAFTLLALVSGGPLGDGRMAALGPSPWRVGLAVLVELVLPAASASALAARSR